MHIKWLCNVPFMGSVRGNILFLAHGSTGRIQLGLKIKCQKIFPYWSLNFKINTVLTFLQSSPVSRFFIQVGDAAEKTTVQTG